MRKEILRLIDANLNRSREGLRVCEDIARFVLNSRQLTAELKSTRHAITGILKQVKGGAKVLSEARDSYGDIGKRSGLGSEFDRRSCADIFSANLERTKESLRVLEEFFKLLDAKAARKFQSLRFKVYGIEKKAFRKIPALRNFR